MFLLIVTRTSVHDTVDGAKENTPPLVVKDNDDAGLKKRPNLVQLFRHYLRKNLRKNHLILIRLRRWQIITPKALFFFKES
jgi:hypothetical protein